MHTRTWMCPSVVMEQLWLDNMTSDLVEVASELSRSTALYPL